ncbi:MAG TPA: UxaA family hydrolase [Syntrophorhabdaceae bacterium]|jgi:altronate dehydratase
MKEKTKALALSTGDNVATALVPLEADATVAVDMGRGVEKVKLLSPIPLGHKFALRDLEEGQSVIKYGESIGTATAPIRKGAYVHVHNVRGGKRRGG